MKTILYKLSGGEINIHAIAFWITLVLALIFFSVVLIIK
jgi:hypothetical protein